MNNKNNWDSENLKNKVKSYTHRRYAVVIKDNQIGKEQLEEDCIYKSFFDEKGNNIKVSYYDIQGNIWVERLFTYDEKNNIVSNINHSSNKIDTVEICEYDSCGNLSKSTQYGGQIFKSIYEYKNQIILEHCYFNDKYSYFWFYKYDAKENLIECKKCTEEEVILGDDTCIKKGEFYQKSTYKYDDCGNKVEMTNYNTDNSINEQQFYEHNELGDVIKKIRIFETKKEELTIFEYEYDNVGNWIKEIRYDNNIPIAITERTFEYFEEDCPF